MSALQELRRYLVACWQLYGMYPCGTLVQSKWTGKARLVMQLERGKTVVDDVEMQMLNVTPVDRAAAYPRVSPLSVGLYERVFDSLDATPEERLTLAIHHAMKHWDEPSGIRETIKGRAVTYWHSVTHEVTEQAQIQHHRLLVFALGHTERISQDAIRRFMLVLHKVNRQLGLTYPGTTGKRVGLVGLVITTNPRFLPGHTRLIRPFILTDTFDRFNTATQRRSLENANYLRLMGRRMWSHNGPANIDRAADLVAPMVHQCGFKKKYDEDQMFGVPALLCRLGLRITPSSPLAARLVDEFGAMLLYADPTRDVYVAEYISEPMLALGAAFAWYQDKFDPLAKCILPHFREMVAHELIRLPSRGVDEIVARIVFLMAMDFAAVNPTERALSSSRRYNGHLASLRVFLQALSGESFRAVRWTRHGTERDRSSDAEAFVCKWDDWLLGFTQFIQLPRLPTPTVLRVLLERRAAGVFLLPTVASTGSFPSPKTGRMEKSRCCSCA